MFILVMIIQHKQDIKYQTNDRIVQTIKGSHFSSFQTTAPGRRSRWTVPLPALPKLPRMSSRSQERSRNTPEPEPGSGAKRTRDLRNKISFWKRRSASITDYDPQYRVTYLGNVLTGWAKGEKAFHSNFTIHAIMF